ncbi:MAG TPA: hypothetical protein EYM99_05735 [Alphaproteobacteria bacterium]|nr:hypothetical protein [Alphaproteobacteria bacterium]
MLRAHRVTKGIRSAVYGSPVYQLSLMGRAPNELNLVPPDPWPSQSKRAEALFHGNYVFAGEEIRSPRRPPWMPDGISEDWIAALHGFEWLRDLKGHGGEAAQRLARALITDWMDTCGRWKPVVWRADVLGQRLAALLTHAPFLVADSSDDFAKTFYQSLAKQTRHLARVVDQDVTGARRIMAIRGLIYATLCLSSAPLNLTRVLKLLDRELNFQILPDGGHFERSPEQQCRVLGDLGDIRAILSEADHAVPQRLIQSLDQMGPMLRGLRHGDGGLACFNGSGEGNPTLIDAALSVSRTDGQALTNAPHIGFQRVAANKALAIMDTGASTSLDGSVYAGTLSFEMSVGKERLVVNCGPYRGGDGDWHEALRRTAAHSTVTVDDTDSSKLIGTGFDPRPLPVNSTREEQSGAVWVDATHDGYVPRFGLRHRRRIYLDADGGDLRGEDRLERVEGMSSENWQPRPLTARFHLHPSVRASLVKRNQAVLLRLPSGLGWQFHAQGGAIGLHDSVYFGVGGLRRRTEQVVLSSTTSSDLRVLKWAFRRIVAPS